MERFSEFREGLIGTARRGTIVEVDDSGSQQMIKKLRGLASDRPEDVYRPQSHGFSSNPPADAEGLLLALGGRSDRLVGLGFEHKDHRPKSLPSGGVALYDADGKVIKIVKDEIDIDAGGKPVTIRNATTVKIEGTTTVAMGVGGVWVRVTAEKVHLGVTSATGVATAKVMTEDGPSEKVFAVV